MASERVNMLADQGLAHPASARPLTRAKLALKVFLTAAMLMQIWRENDGGFFGSVWTYLFDGDGR